MNIILTAEGAEERSALRDLMNFCLTGHNFTFLCVLRSSAPSAVKWIRRK